MLYIFDSTYLKQPVKILKIIKKLNKKNLSIALKNLSIALTKKHESRELLSF